MQHEHSEDSFQSILMVKENFRYASGDSDTLSIVHSKRKVLFSQAIRIFFVDQIHSLLIGRKKWFSIVFFF